MLASGKLPPKILTPRRCPKTSAQDAFPRRLPKTVAATFRVLAVSDRGCVRRAVLNLLPNDADANPLYAAVGGAQIHFNGIKVCILW